MVKALVAAGGMTLCDALTAVVQITQVEPLRWIEDTSTFDALRESTATRVLDMRQLRTHVVHNTVPQNSSTPPMSVVEYKGKQVIGPDGRPALVQLRISAAGLSGTECATVSSYIVGKVSPIPLTPKSLNELEPLPDNTGYAEPMPKRPVYTIEHISTRLALSIEHVRNVAMAMISTECQEHSGFQYLGDVWTEDWGVDAEGRIGHYPVIWKLKPHLWHPSHIDEIRTRTWIREMYALGYTLATLLARIERPAPGQPGHELFEQGLSLALRLLRGELRGLRDCVKDVFFGHIIKWPESIRLLAHDPNDDAGAMTTAARTDHAGDNAVPVGRPATFDAEMDSILLAPIKSDPTTASLVTRQWQTRRLKRRAQLAPNAKHAARRALDSDGDLVDLLQKCTIAPKRLQGPFA